MNSKRKKKCIATGCEIRVSVRVAFCKNHWRVLPYELKQEWKRRVWECDNLTPGADAALGKLVLQCMDIAAELERNEIYSGKR